MDKGVVTVPKKEYQEFRLWLKFRQFIPLDQVWFWTTEWQKKEHEAEQDIRAGRLSGPFVSGKDLMRSLKTKKW